MSRPAFTSTTSPTHSAICNTAQYLGCNAPRSSHVDRRLIAPKRQPARPERILHSCLAAFYQYAHPAHPMPV